MLRLKNSQDNQTASLVRVALSKGISVAFRDNEFVAVLGGRLGQDNDAQRHRRRGAFRRATSCRRHLDGLQGTRLRTPTQQPHRLRLQAYNLIPHPGVWPTSSWPLTLSVSPAPSAASAPSMP